MRANLVKERLEKADCGVNVILNPEKVYTMIVVGNAFVLSSFGRLFLVTHLCFRTISSKCVVFCSIVFLSTNLLSVTCFKQGFQNVLLFRCDP